MKMPDVIACFASILHSWDLPFSRLEPIRIVLTRQQGRSRGLAAKNLRPQRSRMNRYCVFRSDWSVASFWLAQMNRKAILSKSLSWFMQHLMVFDSMVFDSPAGN